MSTLTVTFAHGSTTTEVDESNDAATVVDHVFECLTLSEAWHGTEEAMDAAFEVADDIALSFIAGSPSASVTFDIDGHTILSHRVKIPPRT